MSSTSTRGRLLLPLIVGLALTLATVFTFVQLRRQWLSTEEQGPPSYSALPDFALVDQAGRAVDLESLAGTPWIADFIFTRCGIVCPRMTEAMQRLGESLPAATDVRRVSISVDPEYDTPEVLAAYAAKYGITDAGWLFLTGEREAIHSLAIGGFKLAVDDNPPAGSVNADEPILHSTRFVLVDGAGTIRGYYDAFDPEGQKSLVRDLLALE
jgi:protein SCO1/2